MADYNLLIIGWSIRIGSENYMRQHTPKGRLYDN
jgi:hypothetical protein